jgi:hypothetical protein
MSFLLWNTIAGIELKDYAEEILPAAVAAPRCVGVRRDCGVYSLSTMAPSLWEEATGNGGRESRGGRRGEVCDQVIFFQARILRRFFFPPD